MATGGYKIGDYYQYDKTSNRRLVAGSEFSIRTLCEAGHWSVLSQAPVPDQPDKLMPRRFRSWFTD